MKLSVLGLGLVSKIGAVEDIEAALAKEQIDPGRLASGPSLPVEIQAEYDISPQLVRRMGHFAKISLLSACRAMKDSGLKDLAGKRVGIIQGSVYGPIIAGIQAFDDLIDFGDNQLSPTNFSGSVFNTSSTYLSLAFGIQGPVLTHTSGMDTLYNSLLTAFFWLSSRRVDYVIVGIGDEFTAYFEDHNSPEDQPTGLLPTCEGWTTFILSKDEKGKYGKVEFEYLKTLPETKNRKNIYSVWHERIQTNEFSNHAQANQACFPLFLRGSYPSAAAFDLSLALICAKNERFPMYNCKSGIFQIDSVTTKNEPISCYSPSEYNGFFDYVVFRD